MAAPAEITIQNLNGTYTMNKTLSEDTDALLALQGISWLTRKAISIATVTLKVKEYVQPNNDDPAHAPVIKIDIDQTATGGIKSQEYRTTDWRARDHTDRVFGPLLSQSRLIRGSKGEDGKVRPALELQTTPQDEKIVKFLKSEIKSDGSEEAEGFLVDDAQDKDGMVYGEGEGLWLHSWVRNQENGWTAEQVWGFEMINGQRHHSRRVVVAKDGKYLLARLVYDYNGPNTE